MNKTVYFNEGVQRFNEGKNYNEALQKTIKNDWET